MTKHILHLIELGSDGEWDYNIIHPSECPRSVELLGEIEWIQHLCDIGFHICCAGLDAFAEELPDAPGFYVIEARSDGPLSLFEENDSYLVLVGPWRG